MAYGFNGINSHIETGIVDETNELSISLWFKAEEVSNGARLYWGNGSNKAILHISGSNKLSWYVQTREGNTNYNITSATLDLRSWNNVILNYDSIEVTCYLNGIKDSNTKQLTGLSNRGSLNIGTDYRAGGSWFNGKIQDVRIYNRALSEDEVSILYDISNPEGSKMKVDHAGKVYLKGRLKEV